MSSRRSESPPLDLTVLAEHVRALYAAMKIAAVVAPLGSLLVVALFWDVVEHPQLWIWWSGVFLTMCPMSLILYFQFSRHNRLPFDAKRWLRLIVIRSLIAGAATGTAALLLWVPQSLQYQMFLLGYLVALCSMLTVEIAHHRSVYLVTLISILAPFILRVAVEPDRAFMAVMAGLMLVFLLLNARAVSQLVARSTTLGFANQELVEQLQSEKTTTEAARDDALQAKTLAESAQAEAVEANRAKSRFLAAASHDLRQPMHALGLFTAAVRPHVTTDDGQHIVNKIEASVASTEVMFNALLDVSRLDAGILVPDVKPINVAELLNHLVAEYTPRAEAKGLTLRARRSAHTISSDPSLLERVIRNYLSNAIRYTHRGGLLIGARVRGDRLSIEVWDTGEGIPHDKLKDIFQEFYQLGNPERDKAKGLGLGLAIVKRIGELLAHPIEVVSRLRRGSKFAIKVPLASGIAPENAVDGISLLDETVLVGARVLVIDDEVNVLEAIEIVLKQWGCYAITAESLAQALDKLREQDNAPDVVLSDYRLRDGENGITAVQAIHREWGMTPAALITGDTAPDRLKEAIESGYELLHKPLNPAALKIALCRMLTTTVPATASSLPLGI